MATYRRAEPGKPFDIMTGQAIAVGDYVVTALRLPAARQGKIRLRRPSGDFTLQEVSSGESYAFTLHGDRNYFSHQETLIQILKQSQDGARCVVWPAPAVTVEMAMDIARAWATEDQNSFDYRKGRNMHVNWTSLLSVVAGERRLAWQIDVRSRDQDYRRLGYGKPHWGYSVLVDAVSGEVLNSRRPYE